MLGWIKMPLGMKVGLGPILGPGHIVLDEDPAPSTERCITAFHFLGHIYCGQMAGWIRILLGMEVGLGPGDVVLDGDPAPPRRRGATAELLLVFIVVHLFGVVTDLAQGDTLALLDSHTAMVPFSLCSPLPD